MAHKKRNPAAVATAGRAKGIAALNERAAAFITQNGGKANPCIRRAPPGGNADWLVSIEGVCTDTPMRDKKLRSYKRFWNMMWHRHSVAFAPDMPQAEWTAIVEAAIAKGGVS